MEFTELERHLATITPAQGGGRKIAYFDLDGTLIAGYSIVAVAWETARQGARRGELKQALRLVRDTLRQRTLGNGASYHKLVRRITRTLTGLSEATLTELGEEAYRKSIAKTLYREAIALVEAHRAAGHHLVIVTAASQYQVAPIARVLGIDEICCTQLEVVDGHFSGKVITPMCYGEGKALAARRIAKRLNIPLEQTWFYTDSSADLPLMKQVGNPVAVNPSERLAAHARANKWLQLNFETRGRPNLESLLRTTLTTQAVITTTVAGALGKRLGVGNFSNANRMTQLLGDVGSGFAGLEFEIDGLEHLNRARPAVFIFNHQSLLDALVLAHLVRRDVVAFCKQEMAGNLLVGPLLRQAGTIFVDRKEKDQSKVLQQALEVLESGRSLIIAPEGTRSTLGNIQPFKHGAFLLAKKARVPIIPIVLHNVKDALPKGAVLIRPATIRITVLPPVMPEDMGSVRQVCHSIESQYCELLGKSQVAALPYLASA